MKKNGLIVLVWLIMLVSACGNNHPQGTTYQPRQTHSTLASKEKAIALANQRAKRNGVMDSMAYKNAIKLNLMIPKESETFSSQALNALTCKLLSIVAENGIAGYGGNPSFALIANINPIREGKTNTTPQKSFIVYNINLCVANVVDGDIFGVINNEVMGVGESPNEAMVNAISQFKNTEDIQVFLKTSSTKIVNWYEGNLATLKSEIENYRQLGEYTKAYALLVSIPEASPTCFAYAQSALKVITPLYSDQLSTSYYQSMLCLIATNEKEYLPQVGAYMKMISRNTPIYNEAHQAFVNYVERFQAIANEQRAHEMFLEEETLAIERIRVESELKASEALLIQRQTEQEIAKENNNPSVKKSEMIIDGVVSIITFGVEKLLGFLF